MKREPKRLTGTQGRKSQIKSSTTSLLFYFIIFCDLIVHFVKFFKSFNILSMIMIWPRDPPPATALYDHYLLMSRTKTNRRTDREQYTRSNAMTARLLTLVKWVETLTRDWLNTNEWREMVMSTSTLVNTIYRRNIKLTGTLQHVLGILQTTINDLL